MTSSSKGASSAARTGGCKAEPARGVLVKVAMVVAMVVLATAAQAALGDAPNAVAGAARAAAPAASTRRSATVMPQYTVHELQTSDGSRMQELVAPHGRVFAVRWSTLYKPDLSALLGQSFPTYASAALQAARRGGIQRHFHQDTGDLVVQSSGHLHVYTGHAYLRSQWPAGLTPQALGWD